MDWKIIYASTSGNVEAACEHVASRFEKSGHKVNLERSERADAADLISYQNFIFATSTWEHGEINPYFKPVLNDFKNLNLVGKRAAFLGLGDTRYEPVWFCRGIDIARDAFVSAGGTALGESLKINGEPFELFESILEPWCDEVLKLFTDSGLEPNE